MPPWVRTTEASTDSEQSSAEEVKEEVKEEEESEVTSTDDVEDWLARGPRGDSAHGCPSEL